MLWKGEPVLLSRHPEVSLCHWSQMFYAAFFVFCPKLYLPKKDVKSNLEAQLAEQERILQLLQLEEHQWLQQLTIVVNCSNL